MDIIAIEKESFDSFKKKLEQIASFVPQQSSNNTMFIEQEWIEGKELAASLNLPPRRSQQIFVKAVNFHSLPLERKSTTGYPK